MKNNPALYVVGDSTLSSFDDNEYFYPRYGYGTQLEHFFDEGKIKIINLALSGRSSKSFIEEDNYSFLKDNIKKGDFLLIGFGHNDEKFVDKSRFTSANLSSDNKNSFKFYLNEYYINLANNIGAIPILCTPIVRLSTNNLYVGNVVHKTPNGDYKKAIIELAKETNTYVIDLTTETKKLYENIGYENALFYHAVLEGELLNGVVVLDDKSLDKTHLNIFGARTIAYLFSRIILNSDNPLREYLNEKIRKPLKQEVLKVNDKYKLKQ